MHQDKLEKTWKVNDEKKMDLEKLKILSIEISPL